jgi:hypothetical protein
VVYWGSIEYESAVFAVGLLEAVFDEFVERSEVVGELCFGIPRDEFRSFIIILILCFLLQLNTR